MTQKFKEQRFTIQIKKIRFNFNSNAFKEWKWLARSMDRTGRMDGWMDEGWMHACDGKAEGGKGSGRGNE